MSSAAKLSRCVDLLRHGEAAGGACFRGSRDDPLTPAGWAQLEVATAVDAAAGAWDRVLCSPAQRCAAFADVLGARLGVPVTALPALRERHFGAWEGQAAARLPAADLAAFWSDPAGFTPPGAEPLRDFRARVASGWQEVMTLTLSHRQPLVVTHGGVVRAILGEVLGLADASLLLLEVPHACRTRIRLPEPQAGGLPSLVAHGC
ncbi:histidine phosphatase family protein [Thiohalocapsa halophila]|uniref:Histidine phosphatase family protein n=1 Tax=Thiohalocapsa halophila TaxID=69359 RepID=A0ABS1CCJ4_9GAMM|nr:histidine phosphatase family protein [Thiohalocapsa halophila]MBK1629633.1 histidine phosphatase family protein [Thiohalocapsa halophila]